MHRIKSMLVETVAQWCSLKSLTRRDLAGVGHAFMFWGFLLFFISYVVFIGISGGFGLSVLSSGSTFEKVYSLILDVAGLAVIASVVWAVTRRYILKPERLKTSAEAGVILILIFLLMMLHFCIESFGYAAYNVSVSWSAVGAAFGNLLIGTGISTDSLATIYQSFWWFHYVVILGFMVYIPYSKHLHIFLAPFNVLFKFSGPQGALKPLRLEEAKTFGVSKIQDFTWKHLLDLYSCTECGRCHENCPAQLGGKPLDPREVILNLRNHLLEVGPALFRSRDKGRFSFINPRKAMIGEVITKDAIWACLDCGACQEVCPVDIQQMVKITEMKRNLVLEQASIPRSGEEALKSIETDGHPWRGVSASRVDWARGLNVKILAEDSDCDILYWVGCTSALEERSKKVAVALAKLLKQAGVNFSILGDEEPCCGDPTRHLGSEYLYQLQVERNIELLKSYRVKRIVTGCPHCYNTLKHEYPHFGSNFEVQHHTELIASLVQEGKLSTAKGDGSVVTYHDSCYLGRFNGIYEPPRQILKSMPHTTMVEMAKNREKSFCCGAGGGHLWMEEQRGQQRINEMRTEHALNIKAQTVATACPYCLQMFEDGIKAKEAETSLKAMDIAELLAQSQV
ncbi:(Fe-S)-binding protein [Chloroflexota bacterium]